jgi:hypothetical protein
LHEAGGWALLLALPYFITFFWSYSYHYRLGIAILPLLLLPTAIALSLLLAPERIRRWSGSARRGYYLALCGLSLPGIIAVATDTNWSKLWLMDDALDNDIKKYQVFNPSLLEVVFGLEDYVRETGSEPVVLAPGEERLPFFFPQMQIVDQPVTRLAEYEALGFTHFIYGAKAREAYHDAGIGPEGTQLVSALGRVDLFRKTKAHYKATFSYELYQSYDLKQRFVKPERLTGGAQNQIEVIFDGRIRLRALSAYPSRLFRDTPITFQPTWIALEPLERDYESVLRLQNDYSGEVVQEWRLRSGHHRHGHYAPKHWEVGEYVNDFHVLRLDADAEISRGGNYRFSIGVWDPAAGAFLPLTIDGADEGEFFTIAGIHEVPS